MTKIISTIGPVSSKKNIRFCEKKSEILRFNMSHNSISWHKKNISISKKINPNKYILVDIPGAKPRTTNIGEIKIRKGQKVKFSYAVKNKKIIPISNPLPKLSKKNIKFFSLSDGTFIFKLVSYRNKILTGISNQNFNLTPKRGLNLPYAIYNDNFQLKIYDKFIKKISSLKYDCLGLSFIQNSRIIKILKKKYKNKIFISKIENFLGYMNRKEIIKNSDVVMIDRGDLAAEIGNDKLTEYSENIIADCKKYGKPVIIATENLNSLINSVSPSKSDILNLDYYLSKKIDFIMLSDETATSINWKNTLSWLEKYLEKRNRNKKISQPFELKQVLKHLTNQVLIIFSKKGHFLNNFQTENFSKLFVFTENKNLARLINLKQNICSYCTKFPKKNIDEFLFKNIKKNKKLIFKNNDTAFLINVSFPRKSSRANTFIILSKKDF